MIFDMFDCFKARKIKSTERQAPVRRLFLIRVNEWHLSSICLKKYYADHLVETNNYVADILSVISVMIGKQHHVLVLQGKGPYKNPKKKSQCRRPFIHRVLYCF